MYVLRLAWCIYRHSKQKMPQVLAEQNAKEMSFAPPNSSLYYCNRILWDIFCCSRSRDQLSRDPVITWSAVWCDRHLARDIRHVHKRITWYRYAYIWQYVAPIHPNTLSHLTHSRAHSLNHVRTLTGSLRAVNAIAFKKNSSVAGHLDEADLRCISGRHHINCHWELNHSRKAQLWSTPFEFSTGVDGPVVRALPRLTSSVVDYDYGCNS